ncbi:MAG: hypothetical protein FWC50_00405 [Planctomycetaceae bacterium]|nr:hypothetical protein [Planctomycetaceae bacterium]
MSQKKPKNNHSHLLSYDDDGKPFMAIPLQSDDGEETPFVPDVPRLRRLRCWMIVWLVLTMSSCFFGCVTAFHLYWNLGQYQYWGYWEEGLYWLNSDFFAATIFFLLLYLVVMFRLSRALGHTLTTSVIHLTVSALLLLYIDAYITPFTEFPLPGAGIILPIGSVFVARNLYINVEKWIPPPEKDQTE